MAGIFIGYRRDDTGGYAGRLAQDLRGWFGNDQVFLDLNIRAGTTFADQIERELKKCAVMIALIGQSWLSAADAQGRRRIDQPHDFVRLELTEALRRRVPVVPVLVQGARLPRADDLPEALRGLLAYQATEILDTHWELGVRELAWTLSRSGVGLATRRRRWVQRTLPALMMLGVGSAGVVAAWTHSASEHRAPLAARADAPSAAPLVLPVASPPSSPPRAKVRVFMNPIYRDLAGVGAATAALAPKVASCFSSGVPRGTSPVEEGRGLPPRYSQCFRLEIAAAGSQAAWPMPGAWSSCSRATRTAVPISTAARSSWSAVKAGR